MCSSHHHFSISTFNEFVNEFIYFLSISYESSSLYHHHHILPTVDKRFLHSCTGNWLTINKVVDCLMEDDDDTKLLERLTTPLDERCDWKLEINNLEISHLIASIHDSLLRERRWQIVRRGEVIISTFYPFALLSSIDFWYNSEMSAYRPRNNRHHYYDGQHHYAYSCTSSLSTSTALCRRCRWALIQIRLDSMSIVCLRTAYYYWDSGMMSTIRNYCWVMSFCLAIVLSYMVNCGCWWAKVLHCFVVYCYCCVMSGDLDSNTNCSLHSDYSNWCSIWLSLLQFADLGDGDFVVMVVEVDLGVSPSTTTFLARPHDYQMSSKLASPASSWSCVAFVGGGCMNIAHTRARRWNIRREK